MEASAVLAVAVTVAACSGEPEDPSLGYALSIATTFWVALILLVILAAIWLLRRLIR